jgi:hypothetical protein
VDVLRLDGLVRWLVVGGKGDGMKEDALRVVGEALREEVEELVISTMVSSSDIGKSPWLPLPCR